MIVFGFTLLVIGIVLAIPGIPGPGIVIVWAGLAILAVEFIWARRLLKRLQDQCARLKSQFVRQKERAREANRAAPRVEPNPD